MNLDTTHGALSVETTGEGAPALVFLHGNSACKEVFAAQLRSPLREHHQLVAIDLPGHGASEDARDPQRTYTIPGYASAVRELLHSLGIERYFVYSDLLQGRIRAPEYGGPMSRSSWIFLKLSFLAALVSVLGLLPVRTARGCKPCGEPTLVGLVSKADVVAVAKVVKVTVVPRAASRPSEEPGREVRWFVSVERRLKGSPTPVLTVKHADSPPCISARVPEPGRYVMLLYFQEGQYAPLTYCDEPLFPIDAQDRVTLTPAQAKELGAATEQVPLQRVVDWVTKRAAQPPQPGR